MKAYSIGREAGCDIVINDRTDVISRRHAVLNVMSSGKMTIIDSSSNGTYVNGIRISPNVPVPVTRKDNISFAHVARLDWNLVPRPKTYYLAWSVAAILALAVICGGGWWAFQQFGSSEPEPVVPDTTIISRVDAEEMMRKNSEEVRKHIEDSLRKDSLRKDSIAKVQKKAEARKQKLDKQKVIQEKKQKQDQKKQPVKPVEPKRVGH